MYAARLPALELNATFRRRPTESAIAGWLRATPPDFRFAVKAQRGSAFRALSGSPEESVAWLTEPLGAFGDRLGAVLFRVPAEIRRDGPWVGGDTALADARLAALLAAWPRSIPLVVELQDPSWHVDETFSAMRAAGAVLCTTDLPPEGDEGATGSGSTVDPGGAADPVPRWTRHSSGAPGHSCTCACAATTTTRLPSMRGPPGSNRSSQPATTCSSSSGTTRSGAPRELAEEMLARF